MAMRVSAFGSCALYWPSGQGGQGGVVDVETELDGESESCKRRGKKRWFFSLPLRVVVVVYCLHCQSTLRSYKREEGGERERALRFVWVVGVINRLIADKPNDNIIVIIISLTSQWPPPGAVCCKWQVGIYMQHAQNE